MTGMGRGSARRWHIRIGLVVTFPLTAIVVTGVALGVLRSLELAQPYTGPRDATRIAEAALREHQRAALSAILFPNAADKPARARFTDGSELALDPRTGALLSPETASRSAFAETLYRIHRGKALGEVGQAVTSGVSLVAAALFLLGLKLRRRRSARHGMSVHRRLGFVPGGFVVVMMGLGAAANYSSSLTRRFDPMPGALATSVANAKDIARLDRVSRAAAKAYPYSPIASMHFSKTRGEPVLFYFDDSSRVYADLKTEVVVKVAPWSSHWSRALFALHTGRAIGRAQPLWIFLAAIVSILLIGSGQVAAFGRPSVRKLIEEKS